MSVRLSRLTRKKSTGVKATQCTCFININTIIFYICAYGFSFSSFLLFPSNQQSKSMNEIKLKACAEINNKQNYLPSYFLLNLERSLSLKHTTPTHRLSKTCFRVVKFLNLT